MPFQIKPFMLTKRIDQKQSANPTHLLELVQRFHYHSDDPISVKQSDKGKTVTNLYRPWKHITRFAADSTPTREKFNPIPWLQSRHGSTLLGTICSLYVIRKFHWPLHVCFMVRYIIIRGYQLAIYLLRLRRRLKV